MEGATALQTLLRLDSSIKDYAWGDTGRLVTLFGLDNPDGLPQAEIWMGAHPADPSRVVTSGGDIPLDEMIAGDPDKILGAAVAQQFEGRLPFLFKVLNAGQPLSIQLHPDKATAQAGYAREEAEGIARDAAHRNYADPNHKPELICALTPFRALCGFRSFADICEALQLVDAPQLRAPLERLQSEGSSAALRHLCLHLLNLEQHEVEAMLSLVLERAKNTERPDLNTLCMLHEYYPGDRGVMFALLLNLVELQPGEALFLAAGHLHSYLDGVGLEIMASSDNVIRGGLTPKHVDCGELSRLARFETMPEADLRVVPVVTEGQTLYPTPVEDFTLALIDVAEPAVSYDISSAEILLCVSGGVSVSTADEKLALSPGQACLVTAAAGKFELHGDGRIARAAVAIPR